MYNSFWTILTMFFVGAIVFISVHFITKNQISHPALSQSTVHKIRDRPYKIEEHEGMWVISAEEKRWTVVDTKEIKE